MFSDNYVLDIYEMYLWISPIHIFTYILLLTCRCSCTHSLLLSTYIYTINDTSKSIFTLHKHLIQIFIQCVTIHLFSRATNQIATIPWGCVTFAWKNTLLPVLLINILTLSTRILFVSISFAFFLSISVYLSRSPVVPDNNSLFVVALCLSYCTENFGKNTYLLTRF